MRGFNHPTFKYVFLAVDVIIFSVAYFWAHEKIMPDFWTSSGANLYVHFSHLTLGFVYLIIFLFSFRYNNLYKRNIVIVHHRQLILLIKAMLAGGVVCVLFMVFSNISYFNEYGKSQILYFLLYSSVPLFIIRVLGGRAIFKFLIKNKIYRRNVLIVGGDDAGKYVAKSLKEDPYSDFQIVGFLDDYKPVGAEIDTDFNNLGKLEDLPAIVNDRHVDEILVAIDHAPYDRLIHIVESCMQTGTDVKIYSDLLRVIAEKMDVEYYANIPAIALTLNPTDGPTWSDKRIADIALSAIGLIFLSPLFLIIAIGIKLSSKGPLIFEQERFGKGGKPFKFYKFRSMHVGTDNSKHEEYVRSFINGNTDSEENECKTDDIRVFKITDDPRIFRFGRFIRRTSLDEFPQLFNVLKGDMSIVGPRPCLAYEWDCYEDWHKKRLTCLPGCTGLWQALGRSSVSFEEMVILDLYYISNVSMWLDLKIILKTIPVIFFAKGGY
jgi:undecaprenyl-phosphate galactose phosphotransferase